jgi:hypothetical protein
LVARLDAIAFEDGGRLLTDVLENKINKKEELVLGI